MAVIKVMIVEDRPVDAQLVRRALQRAGLTVEALLVDNELDYCTALGKGPDVIICDHNLPQFDAKRALEILRACGHDIPFIVVSGNISEDVAVDCMKRGAADYLLKDRLARLGPAVQHALAEKKLREENRRVAENAAILSEVSGLLAASLAVETIVTTFADYVVHKVADCCEVWIDRGDGAFTRAAVKPCSPEPRVVNLADHVAHLVACGPACLASEPALQGLVPKAFAAALALPLATRQQRLGLLVLGLRESAFDDHSLKLAHELERRLTMALDNAMLYQQAQEALKRQREAHAEAERLYREAQEAHRFKDEFLATVSHELRTPLHAILGFSQMIRDHTLSASESQHALEVIHRNATSQYHLVSDLLDISRIIGGRMTFKRVGLRLDDVVASALESVQLAARAKNIVLIPRLAGGVPRVFGDPERLKQVVWNLLVNAIKFTPKEGQVVIALKDEVSKVALTVTDTGKGMDPAFLPYVFERFRQENSSSVRAAGGLGLGLAIVRHIVELHGGEVEASSAGLGMGSTFTVTLPTLAIDLPEEAEGSLANDGGGRGPDSKFAYPGAPAAVGKWFTRKELLRGIRVMVIDDDLDARTLVKLFLERVGASVTALESARKALEQLDTIKPHVVICDIGMPEMDGYSFVQDLRAREKGGLEHIPAAALTAFCSEGDRRRALESGFEEHVAKPVEVTHLIDIVCRLSRGQGVS